MDNINSNTKLYCVVGNPIEHSLSPIMHNAAFGELGYNGVYLAFCIKNLKNFINAIKELDIKGVSVTIPHKLRVMDYLDKIDETAVNIGAVNTIVNKNGKLFGYNTDWIGAAQALLAKTQIKNKKVLMIGAGGAARAVGYGIIKNNGKLSIANILQDEGENLAKELNADFYHLNELNKQDFNKIDYDILINTTPVGMSPNIDEMPIEKESIKENTTVMDIIYNPLKTKLLKVAENLGCKIINGTSMFVHQGAAQFEMWTKQKPPLDIMHKTVTNNLS